MGVRNNSITEYSQSNKNNLWSSVEGKSDMLFKLSTLMIHFTPFGCVNSFSHMAVFVFCVDLFIHTVIDALQSLWSCQICDYVN